MPKILLSPSVSTSLVAQLVKTLPAMQETQIQFLGWEDPLEKEMATHSRILAQEILWTEQPGRLQSMGSQRDTTRTQTEKKAGEDFLCYKISDQPHY